MCCSVRLFQNYLVIFSVSVLYRKVGGKVGSGFVYFCVSWEVEGIIPLLFDFITEENVFTTDYGEWDHQMVKFACQVVQEARKN